MLVIFVALLALTAARADDGRSRAPQGDALDEAPTGAAPVVEAAKGNPLWSAPLSSLSATRERPLFSPSRRPPQTAAPAPPSQIAAPPPPPPAADVAETPPFTLLGTVLSADANLAILLNTSTNAVTRLRQGQSEAGWTAQEIQVRAAVLEKDGVTNTLELPKTTDAPANEPPAAPAAADDAQTNQ
jgi:general secretion pathway protein N